MKVLITGGSKGIGKSICDTLTQAGCTVHYTSRQKNNRPSNCHYLDFEDWKSCTELEELIKSENFEALINNAASTMPINLLTKTDALELGSYISQNVAANLKISQSFVKSRNGESGAIINVLSAYTLSGILQTQLGAYITMKYAMLGLHNVMSKEFSAKKITVNAISPSMTDTAMLDDLFPKQFVEIAVNTHPQHRLAKPQEIANAVKFLLLNSSYIHGINLPITGGV